MVFSWEGQWISGKELYVFIFLGFAVSSWIEQTLPGPSESSCRELVATIWFKSGSVAH